MPTIGTMTEPLCVSDPLPPLSPGPGPEPRTPEVATEGSSTPPSVRRRRRRYTPQPTFHLNIGRVEVPRSLPPTRTLGTQTDESAVADDKELDKKWYRKMSNIFNTYAMPVLRAAVTVLDWVLSRIGFGFRLN